MPLLTLRSYSPPPPPAAVSMCRQTMQGMAPGGEAAAPASELLPNRPSLCDLPDALVARCRGQLGGHEG